MGNICTPGEGNEVWDDIVHACIYAAGMSVVHAFNLLRESYTGDQVSFAKVPSMYKEDLIPLIRQHETEWVCLARKYLSCLFSIDNDVSYWRRAQVFRATRSITTGISRLIRVVGPVLISEFAIKTAQPLGFSAAVSSMLMLALNKHYTALLQDAADLSSPLFLDIDTDSDDVISQDELHLRLLPRYIELLTDSPAELGGVPPQRESAAVAAATVASAAANDNAQESIV